MGAFKVEVMLHDEELEAFIRQAFTGKLSPQALYVAARICDEIPELLPTARGEEGGAVSKPESCPDCHHPWRSHQGRNGGQRCWYGGRADPCPCRLMDPAVKAEDQRAAGLWNVYLGRNPR